MIVTYTGKYFDFLNIKQESIDTEDIIHALTHINRFVGHAVRSYSVAEHTFYGLLLANVVGFSAREKLYWLIHDFTEAYVGDCPSPLKKLLPEYQTIESEVARAIITHLGLNEATEEEMEMVHRMDKTMLILEMRDLTLHDHAKHLNDDVFKECLAFTIDRKSKRMEKQLQRHLKEQLSALLKEVKKDV